VTDSTPPAGCQPIGSPQQSVSIHRATTADARAIAEITVQGWRDAYREILPAAYLAALTIEARAIGWRAWLLAATDATPAWVAAADGRALGFVSAGPPRDDKVEEPAAEIYALYVRTEVHGRGIGRRLLQAATEYLRARGATTLVLWVFEANAPARTFYEGLDWRPDGARRALELGGASALEVRYGLTEK
jgi:GNAT superfamily N-acetyltransferase